MRRVVAVLCASVALAACATSTDTGSASAACDSIASAVCTRQYACDSSLPGSVATCTTAAQTQCPNFSCTNSTTFNSAQASQCLSDINSQDCTDVNNGDGPTSCNTICQ
jgi:hypothetical protein